jgi:hypothetical protein
MNLQELLNKKHNHYIIGYMENNEFWCVQESSSLERAKDLFDQQMQIFPKKQEYLILKKTISYEQLKD